MEQNLETPVIEGLMDGSYPYGPMEWVIEKELQQDYDAKVVLTSRNSKPGVGKTTLAIRLARELDQHGWSAEEKAVMSGSEYQRLYGELPPGSVIVFDEIEGAADRRRAMSHENVGISQAWAQNRYRNIVTICTLPTVSMLDNRLLELSDWWINVLSRGVASPHQIKVNDYTNEVYRDQLDGHIRFNDLPDDDPDYRYLKDKKAELRDSADAFYTQNELNAIVKKAEKEARMDYRNEFIKALANGGGMTTYEIADLEPVGLSQGRVSQIASE